MNDLLKRDILILISCNTDITTIINSNDSYGNVYNCIMNLQKLAYIVYNEKTFKFEVTIKGYELIESINLKHNLKGLDKYVVALKNRRKSKVSFNYLNPKYFQD